MSDGLRLVKSAPPVDDPLRLIVAKAVYGLLRIPTRPFDEQPDHIKDMWFEEADAALAAIREDHNIVRKADDE